MLTCIDLKKQWDAFTHPDSTLLFYSEPERLEKAEAEKSKLINAFRGEILSQQDVLDLWDDFVNSEVLASYHQILKNIREPKPVTVLRFLSARDLQAPPVSSHVRMRAHCHLHKNSEAVSLDHKVEHVSEITEVWKRVLLKSGLQLRKLDQQEARKNPTLLDPDAPVFD